MYKIAVLGDKDSTMGFMALGLDVIFTNSREDAAAKLHNAAQQGYAVIYVTEQIAALIETDIDRYKEEELPAIIMIPSNNGGLGLGMRGIKLCVERAVGADILFGND